MKKAKKIYTAVIIGAGRIGCGFDSPRSRQILTHAHAILANPRVKLVALSDKNVGRGKREAKRWKTKFYSTMEMAYRSERPDIIVIATPDATHAKMLERAAKLGPKLIICEKPISARARQIKTIQKHNIPIIVNLSRRFDPSMTKLRATLQRGRYGKVLSATGIYTKGLFHNGSHMLDLARFLFGEMKSCVAHFHKRDWDGEPSLGGVAVFESCPEFHLQLADARAFAIFELDIITEKKRIRITDEGRVIRSQDVVADPLYKGFKILSRESAKKTKLDEALTELYRHAVSVLGGKEKPRVPLDEALKTQRACAKFARSIKEL